MQYAFLFIGGFVLGVLMVRAGLWILQQWGKKK